MIYNICLATSFGFAAMFTAAWILRVIVMVVAAGNGRVPAMQNILMSLSWAVFYFLWLQK